MAASAIAISFDSSDESVGSPPSRVILFGDIPIVIPSTSVVAPETSIIAPIISSVAPVVETTLVASPAGLCGLVPYSDSDSDSPDEMSSSEHISPLPAISPFLCTDSSEAPDSSDGPPSQDPYVMTVARWRSKVASRPSSSSEFPIAPVTAPLGIRRRSAIRIRPGEAIPFGRPYCTHLNGRRRASPRSSDHHPSSSSSSSDSSPVYSSGLDAPDQAHSGSSTRDVSPRLGYPPRRAPRRSEAFRRWCAAPLSTLYPPTTSESSSGDSSERPLHSSSHSAGPSRKRCRSPVDSVPSSTPVMGSLAPTHADLLPPRKRFKDSYLSEASIEEDTEIDPIETEVDMELGIGDGDDVRDHVEIDPRDVRDDTEEYEADTSAGDTVEVGIDPMSAPIVEEEIVEPAGEDSSDSSGIGDGIIVRSFEDMPIDLDDVVRDFYHHMSEVRIDRIVGIKTVQRRTMTNTHSGMTPTAIEEMINQRVDAALEARRVNRDLELGNGNGNGNGTGNGNNGGDNSNGTEGVVGLIRWSEKIETVFHISNCPERYQVKYATCTLLDSALTWWNSHKRTIGTDAAYALSWRELLKLMIEVYCPRNEIQKMETELWSLSVKNNDMATYT
ncbi:reverse transcriptase domain-containing protein [Tanacetum coccineum]|uniref:Reverse transcriptase domain-containing protein n=1 Tax=Tanacetum coccineum TaxID=301880 RepID=A0ABQ5IS22_9ASTR